MRSFKRALEWLPFVVMVFLGYWTYPHELSASSIGKPAASVTVGTAATLQAITPSTGALGVSTNSFYDWWVGSAGAWRYFLNGREMFPTTTAGFTARNTLATIVDTSHGPVILNGNAQNLTQLSVWMKAKPGASFVLTMLVPFERTNGPPGGGCVGPVLSDGTKYLDLLNFNDGNLYLDSWTNLTTHAGITQVFGGNNLPGSPHWLQIEEDATNRFYRTSNDGIAWYTVFSEAKATFLATSEVGFGADLSGTQVLPCPLVTFEAN